MAATDSFLEKTIKIEDPHLRDKILRNVAKLKPKPQEDKTFKPSEVFVLNNFLNNLSQQHQQNQTWLVVLIVQLFQ